MIVDLSESIARRDSADGEGVLASLRDYWRAQRGDLATPPAETLYLSDLVAEMPHVLLCFRDEAAYRIEFAGTEVQDILGFDPTGEILLADDAEPLLAALARSADKADRQARPESCRGDGWRSVLLPFQDARARVTVLLVGVVRPGYGPSAEVLRFPAASWDTERQ